MSFSSEPGGGFKQPVPPFPTQVGFPPGSELNTESMNWMNDELEVKR